jgi:hypothetical protein
MSQKVKAIDTNGTHQTVNVNSLATTEIKDVGENQEHSVTIIDINGNSTTYTFIGRMPKR